MRSVLISGSEMAGERYIGRCILEWGVKNNVEPVSNDSAQELF